MLSKSIRITESNNVNIKFSDKPIKYDELGKYYDAAFFDCVICTANSISHAPLDQLNDVLFGMVSLLKHKGVVILDAKRYADNGREIEYDRNNDKIKIRAARETPFRAKIRSKEILGIKTYFSSLNGLDAVYHIEIRYLDGKNDCFLFQFW